MRLTGHVWFSVLGYEIMSGWIPQKLDQDGGAGLLNSDNDGGRVSTKAN